MNYIHEHAWALPPRAFKPQMLSLSHLSFSNLRWFCYKKDNFIGSTIRDLPQPQEGDFTLFFSTTTRNEGEGFPGLERKWMKNRHFLLSSENSFHITDLGKLTCYLYSWTTCYDTGFWLWQIIPKWVTKYSLLQIKMVLHIHMNSYRSLTSITYFCFYNTQQK